MNKSHAVKPKGPTDCNRKNANRAHRDPRFHFKDRHTVSFFISTMASMEPQFHRRNKLNTHTSCACIWLVAARGRHNNTRSISVVPQELIEKGGNGATGANGANGAKGAKGLKGVDSH